MSENPDINLDPNNNNQDDQQQQQQHLNNNPNRPRRILMMGPNDGGKTSMAKVIFENWEPARTQYQGKTSGQVREDIFLFGRKMFTFFDCGGQVSYFDDYLKDPYLFNDVAALVFVVDATLFFLTSSQDGGSNGHMMRDGGSSSNQSGSGRTWNSQTIRDVFAKIIKTLLDRSPGARVFIMLNKMDKVFTTAMERAQVENVLIDQGRKLQRVAYDGVMSHRYNRRNNNKQDDQQQQQQQQNENDGSHQDGNQQQDGANNNNNSNDEKSSTSANISLQELERAIPLFKTSIFNHTIVHAWSRVITRLIEPSFALRALRDWLRKIRDSADGEILEAALLDSSTMLCVASSSAFAGDDGNDDDYDDNDNIFSGDNNNNNNTNSNINNNKAKDDPSSSSNTTNFPLSSEVAIRAKRQRLKGLEFVSITHPTYNMVWRTCIPDTLQLLLVGDGAKTSVGVTQHNAETLVEWFNATFVEENNQRLPPPWPMDVVQVRQLLGTL